MLYTYTLLLSVFRSRNPPKLIPWPFSTHFTHLSSFLLQFCINLLLYWLHKSQFCSFEVCSHFTMPVIIFKDWSVCSIHRKPAHLIIVLQPYSISNSIHIFYIYYLIFWLSLDWFWNWVGNVVNIICSLSNPNILT